MQNGHVSVTSPFSGTITSRLVEVGHMVRPMDEMFEIVEVNTSLSQTAQKVVHFGIPAEDRIKISEGQSVNIHWPQTGFSALGTVVRMSRAVDGQARNLMVQAEIKDSEKEFPHNTRVFVTYESEEPSVLRVPSYSLKRRGSDYFLWVMDESKTPWQISVEVIAEDGEWSDVRGNFSLNDRVISNPSVTLFRESQLRQ